MNAKLIYTSHLFFSLLAQAVFAQDIEKRFSFYQRAYPVEILVYDNITLRFDSTYFQSKKRARESFVYVIKDKQKVDSIFLKKGQAPPSPIDQIAVSPNLIAFYLASIQQIVSVNRVTGKCNFNQAFDPSAQNISYFGIINNHFIVRDNIYLKVYDPETNGSRTIFDYEMHVASEFKHSIGADGLNTIENAFGFYGSEVLLVKTALTEAGASFDCVYYFVDMFSGKVEKLPFSHFEELIVEPRVHLKKNPLVRLDTFSIDIEKMYRDVSDSVGYLTCRFPYEEKIDKTHSKSKRYQQDAFVVDKNFNLMDRALQRQISIQYPIYENGKKTWNVISSQTDSSKSCFFKIKLNYALEKAFYNIYHNTRMSQKSLQGFDKYELMLLKNFVFAKHNYGFNNPFYQAYFNTFIFYSDEQKKKSRKKNVDNLLTNSDRSNLAILQKAVK